MRAFGRLGLEEYIHGGQAVLSRTRSAKSTCLIAQRKAYTFSWLKATLTVRQNPISGSVGFTINSPFITIQCPGNVQR